MSDASKAEEQKKIGNEMFQKGKFNAAIEAYSEAIMFAPNEPVFRTNRAMCHRKKENWDSVVADCREALRLDDTTIKGHYLLGVALDAQLNHEDAVWHLHRALELCKEKTISYREDIQRAMLSARKRQWLESSAATEQQIGTTERVLGAAVRGYYAGGGGGSSDEAAMVERGASEAVDAWRATRGPERHYQVPDYFCCKITMEIMLDPVTTPDGVTFEKSVLLDHFRKVGRFDPVTRRELTEQQLHPNLALKEAINDYLARHPWAYEADV